MKSTLINEQVSVKKEKQRTRSEQRKVKTITVATSNVSVLFPFYDSYHCLCFVTLIASNASQIV